MKFDRLYEQIEEAAISKKFSGFTNDVNGLADLLSQEEPPEDFIQSLTGYGKTMQYWQKEIGSLQMTDDEWETRRVQQMPKEWNTARDLICRGKIQRILMSIDDVVKEPVSKNNVKVKVLKERVDDLRDLLTGIAAVPMAAIIPPT